MTTNWTERVEPSISFTERTKPTTTLDMRDSLGRIWAEMDDTWAIELLTWAELGDTSWTARTKP